MLCLSGSDQADGSRTAICIYYRLCPGKTCVLQRLVVQNFRLHRIHLIERLGGNTESHTAQFVLDIAFAVDYLLAVTQNHAGASVVDIDHNGCNLRMELSQGFDEVILGRHDRGSQNQYHHDLSGCMTDADQHMSEQAITGILIIGADFK